MAAAAGLEVELLALKQFAGSVRDLRTIVQDHWSRDLGAAQVSLHALVPSSTPSAASALMRDELSQLADDYGVKLGHADASLQTVVRQLDVLAAVADLVRARYEQAESVEAVSEEEVGAMFQQAVTAGGFSTVGNLAGPSLQGGGPTE